MANESEPRIRYGEATMRRGRNPVRRVPDQKIDGTPRLPELGSPVYHPKARAIVPGRGALLKVFLKREVIELV